MNATGIRVADAPPIRRGRSAENDMRNTQVAVAAQSGDAKITLRVLFFTVVLVDLVAVYFAAFGPRNGGISPILIYARYLLWPLCTVAFCIHASRFGVGQVFRAIAMFLPFFGIGVIAALLGIFPLISVKLLFFWIFGVVMAAVAGLELPPRFAERLIFWFFLAVVIFSIAAAFGLPRYGTMADTRAMGGVAWRGIFAGKNQLGEAAAYLLLLTWVVRTGGGMRVIATALAIAALIMAQSQGSVMTAIIVIGLTFGIVLLRRMGFTPGLQAAILILMTFVAGFALIFGLGPLLGLLGRDPTLTGRTEIWDLFLNRALYFWPIGAGPGSFTDISYVTYDLTLALSKVGRITQPHNMYIATLGESGFFGVIALLLPLAYVALVLPFTRQRENGAMAASTVALIMLIGGLVETHEVYGTAARMALVVLMFASMQGNRRVEDPNKFDLTDLTGRTGRLLA